MMQHLTNETILDYIHGALSPQEDAAVYAHLEQCAQCRSENDAELALGEALRAHAAATELEMPATLKAAIWSEIRAAKPSVWNRIVAGFRPAIALPVAAVLAVALYFGVSSLNNQGGPTIEAAYYLQDHAAMNGTVPFSDRNANPVDMESTVNTANETAVAIEATSYTADASQHR